MHLDNFFEIIGIEILVGYGLTETSPVTRMSGVPGITCEAHLGSRFRVQKFALLTSRNSQPLPVGQRGLILVRGPQIMQGTMKLGNDG